MPARVLFATVRIVYRFGDEERSVRCAAYEEFPEELVCYDAAAEYVASIPREAVVAVETEPD